MDVDRELLERLNAPGDSRPFGGQLPAVRCNSDSVPAILAPGLFEPRDPTLTPSEQMDRMVARSGQLARGEPGGG